MARKPWRDGYVSAHISNTVAAQITKRRVANGWTQTQLADKVGMKQSRISALEDPNWQNVEVATLRRLASAFDVGLTVRFIPFSELAEWAATLTDDRLLVPSYTEESVEKPQLPAVKSQAAEAFARMLGQPQSNGLYGTTVANENTKRLESQRLSVAR